ncbi:MAG: Hsp20/alpha crystallin family protein [Gammaproteobacteria bacterium]
MPSKSTSKEVAKEQAGREAAARPSRGLVSFEDLDRMFDRMFEDFLPRRWMRPFGMPWAGRGEVSAFEGRLPSVDVIDRETEVVVKAELPGVDKKDLDVSLSDNAVTIKASTHQEEKEEKGDYCRAEIAHGSFVRTVALPAEVDESKCKATFSNGVLELTVPKLEQARRRKIEVQ